MRDEKGLKAGTKVLVRTFPEQLFKHLCACYCSSIRVLVAVHGTARQILTDGYPDSTFCERRMQQFTVDPTARKIEVNEAG
jgi:hypothetical protein